MYTQPKKFRNTTLSSTNSNKYLIQKIENKCVSKTECPLSDMHKINTQTVMHGCPQAVDRRGLKQLNFGTSDTFTNTPQ